MTICVLDVSVKNSHSAPPRITLVHLVSRSIFFNTHIFTYFLLLTYTPPRRSLVLISYFSMQIECIVHLIPLYTTIQIILAELCKLWNISLGPCKILCLSITLFRAVFIPLRWKAVTK